MKNVLILYGALFLLLANGCKDSSSDPSSADNGVIIPLALNNKWIYKVETFDSSGSIKQSPFDSITINITGDTVINGESWYQIDGSHSRYFRNKLDGYYSYYQYPILEYKYPAKDGDSIMITNTLKRKVLSVNKSIIVNNKTFTTYLYLDTYPQDVTDAFWYTYIAPNIGQVRFETYRMDSNMKYYLSSRIDLVSYKLN